MASVTRLNLYNVAIPGVANTSLAVDVVAVFDAATSDGNAIALEYYALRPGNVRVPLTREQFLDIKLVKGI